MSSPEPISTQLLRAAGVDLQPGLSDRDIDVVQRQYGFSFLLEHRAFLQRHLPVGDSWPDWRGMPPALQDRLDWPVEGVLFDVAENEFWAPTWGPRPAADDDAVALARDHLARVPRLVPVYSHRFLPAAPAPAPAPVFSVHQSDVIRYGDDLDDYLVHEFSNAERPTSASTSRIPFWDDLAGDWS